MPKFVEKINPIIKGAVILFIGKLLLGFLLVPLIFRLFVGFNNTYILLYGGNTVIFLMNGTIYATAGFVIGRDVKSKLYYGILDPLLYLLLIRLFYIGEALLLFPVDQKAKYIDAIFKSTFTPYIFIELLPIVIFVLIGFWIGRKIKVKN